MVVLYSFDSLAYEVDVGLSTSPAAPVAGEPIVCHCLQVGETAIVCAVRDAGARSLCQLACLTGAGSGCTACHRRLRHYLAEGRSQELATRTPELGATTG